MKYDCIMLAAGLSSRMGQWKLLLNYNGKTLIENALNNAAQYTNNIIISGGHRFDELKKNLPDNNQIQIINNHNFKKGMLSSIKAAMPYIKTDKFFISLSDMPLIPAELYLQMSLIDFSNALFPVFNNRRGHPVLIDSGLKDKILATPDSGRMKDILKGFEVSELQVDTDNIFFDVDTDIDYRKLLNS